MVNCICRLITIATLNPISSSVPIRELRTYMVVPFTVCTMWLFQIKPHEVNWGVVLVAGCEHSGVVGILCLNPCPSFLGWSIGDGSHRSV